MYNEGQLYKTVETRCYKFINSGDRNDNQRATSIDNASLQNSFIFIYKAELEKKKAMQQAQIDALKAERDQIEEDNNLQGVEVENLKEQIQGLENTAT